MVLGDIVGANLFRKLFVVMRNEDYMSCLRGKIALVTGAAQGIGEGVALEMARAGADIIIGDLNVIKAEEVAKKIGEMGGNALAIELDVTDTVSIQRVIEIALSKYSKIDVLVNNAGVVQEGLGDETRDEDFDLCYKVNLKSIWLMSNMLFPYFKQNQQGRIINIASGSGRVGGSLIPAYCASKAAAISLTQSLACKLAPYNINVNAVCPGSVWTPMWEKMEGMLSEISDQKEPRKYTMFNEAIAKYSLLNRAPTPSDIGKSVVFFASSSADVITGQALNVDGGVMMN